MRRRVILVVIVAAAIGLLGGAVAAQPGGQSPSSPEPTAQATAETEPALAGERELGARLGLVTGGRVTPGGMRLAALYLYQLSDIDWFEGAIAFTFGGGAAACFRDREDTFLCDHGPLAGTAIGLSVGIRRFLSPQGRFTPYVRVQLGVGVAQYSDDAVQGLTLPAVVGGGVRARLTDFLAVGADAALEAGVGFFNSELGIEPQIGLQVAGVVEFSFR